MLSDFCIPRLSNDMKIAVQKNNLGGQIWYISLDSVKKTAYIALEHISNNPTCLVCSRIPKYIRYIILPHSSTIEKLKI